MSLEEIRSLEKLAACLDVDARERKQLFDVVNQYACSYMDAITEQPTYSERPVSKSAIIESAINEQGMPVSDILALLADEVDGSGINMSSGRYLGYIPGGGLYPAALGDYLAAVSNRYAGLYFASPGAVRIENTLLRWMAGVFHYPATAAGNLTSGGSMANLTAIITARDAFGVSGEAISKSVIYLTEHTHHSINKALHIAGVDGCVIRRIPVDANYRLKTSELEMCISEDIRAGLKPWLVIATAGTTNTGAVDDLAHIGDICSRHGIWFHADGAYGGFFNLCPEGQVVLKGIDTSDSLIVDPHKSLFLPYGSGAVLVKDSSRLYRAFNAEADYIENILDDVDELSPADLSPELTKHFRGLRLWLPLKLLGVAPFRAALSEKMQLARHFHEEMGKVSGFEVGPVPDLSIVIYRYLPKRGDVDEFNQRLMQMVQKEGRIFVSSTRIEQKFVLRAAILSFRTHLDEVNEAMEVLSSAAKRLEQE